MKKEITIQAKTVDEAVALGAAQLGTDRDNVVFEVTEEPKKGFLGMGSSPATVKITYVFKPLEAARSFVETLIRDLELDAEVTIHDDGNGEALMTVTGTGASALIGHHGDTLDAFQYLVNLAANKKETDERKFTRITVDIENYREKREQTLRTLASRMAEKVKKTGKNVTLEPMNAYERRIIHSETQNIAGVSTNSVGAEGNRRVVIYPEGTAKPTEESVAKSEPRENRDGGKDRRFQKKDRRPRKFQDKGEKTERTDRPDRPVRTERQDRPSERPSERPAPTYKRDPDKPRPQPRKIEKAKDLDAYFEKLKAFSQNNGQSGDSGSDD